MLQRFDNLDLKVISRNHENTKCILIVCLLSHYDLFVLSSCTFGYFKVSIILLYWGFETKIEKWESDKGLFVKIRKLLKCNRYFVSFVRKCSYYGQLSFQLSLASPEPTADWQTIKNVEILQFVQPRTVNWNINIFPSEIFQFESVVFLD